MTVDEILPDEILSTLSPSVARVYAIIWNRMAESGSTTVTIADAEVSRHARVTLLQLPAVLSELSSTGLLTLVPGHCCTEYQFPDDPLDELSA